MRRPLSYIRHVAGSLVPLLGLASVWPILATDLNPKQVGIYLVNSQNWQAASVTVSGTHAYVIATDYNSVQQNWVGNLLILDIANPVRPALVGTYRLPNPGGGSVTVRNDLAYLAAGPDGVLILNVSDPKTPRRVGSFRTSQAHEIFMVGNYAYVADSYAGLLILDVSNPTSPQRVGGLVSEHEAFGVFVSGTYAYLAEAYWNDSELRSDGTLEIMDISNRASPQLIGNHPIGSGAYNGVLVAGDVAYVCADGMEMFDVKDPANALNIGNYPLGGRGVVLGNRAYICGGGMHILDLSQPNSPKRVGGYQTSGSAWGLGVGGQYAYVGISGQGLAVLDLDPPANLPHVGGLETPGSARDLAISGARAYVADSVGGMQILDITDPRRPSMLGNYAMANQAQLVAAHGNYAFVVETWKIAVNSYGYALHVVDVSNPGSPAQLGVYQSSGWASIHALAVNDTGDYAFLSVPNDYPSPGSRIEVIDLRARADPRLVGTYDTGDGGWCHDLALHGQQLIVAQKNLLVLDVSDPASPQPLGSSADYGWGGSGSHIALSGTRAYVASSVGFQAFDLSDPAHPAILGTSPDFGVGWGGLAVFSNYVYAAASASGVQVVDVTDPARLRLLAGNSAVLASYLAVSGNNVFVAGGPEGLQVFDLAISNPPSPGHLDIIRSGSSLVISWPASITAVLESTSQLTSSPAWVSAAETPVVSGNQNLVTVAVGTGTRFFRLRQ